jgi:hypothetical protein
MRENYHSHPDGSGSLLQPPGYNGKKPVNRFKTSAKRQVIQFAAFLFVAFTTQAFAQSYCAPNSEFVDGSGIVNVLIGTISNPTNLEENNYGDFTSQTTNIGQGVTQEFSIGLNTYGEYNVKIWADWNDNFIFDANEEVFNANSPDTPRATVTGAFTVPATAALGNHRLRIGIARLSDEPLIPCYIGGAAAFEDYTVNVLTAPSCYAPTALTYSNTGAGVANLSWTAPALENAVAGYQYAIDTNIAGPANGTATTSTTITGAAVPLNTMAFFHVRTNCGGGDFSAWTTIPFYNGVCIPMPESADGDGITNFTLGTINNNSTDEPSHYGNYANLSTDIGQGVTKLFNLTTSTFSDQFVRIWVDWNNDQDFDDDGENAYSGNVDSGDFNLTGTLLIPSNASLGGHRLRIAISPYYNDPATPCFEVPGTASFEDYTINVTTPPSCFTPLSPTGTNVSPGVANISWTAPVPGQAPTGYEYAVSTSATPPSSGTPVTGTSVSNVSVTPNVINYIHVRTNCGSGNFSEWFSASFLNGYCIPRPDYADGQGIVNVIIGTINSASVEDEPQYVDNTSQIVNIGQGVTQQFTVSLFTFGSYNLKIWIDLNDDLDFNDAGEEVYTGDSANTTRSILTGYFTIPVDAVRGNHRLRMGIVPVWESPADPCSTEYYGDFKDFTVNVTGPPSCYAPTGVTGASSTAGLVNISWTAPAYGGAPSSYQYAVTATNATPIGAGTNVTGTAATNVPVSTNVIVYLHVRSNCGGGGFSEWVTIPYYNGVCIPEPAYVDGQGITNVTIGSINNTTQGEPNFFGNYSEQVVNIGQTVVQPFRISVNVYASYDVKIWVDFNNDLDFDDAGEELYEGASAEALSDIVRGTITIPANAPLGNHRLRVGISAGSPPTPCSVDYAGTFEDYTLNVVGPPSCYIPVDPAGVATASGLANLSWSAPGQGDAAVAYEYYVDTNSSIVSPIANTTTIPGRSVTGYTGFEDNIYHYLHVRTKCGEGEFSEWVTSDRFRFLEGDTCESAIDLGGLTSPYTSTTEGADNNYSPYCTRFAAPDLIYSITVPNGYTFTGSTSGTTYSAVSALFYGSCASPSIISCTEDGSVPLVWENVYGSTKTLYWVQDGNFSSSGDFTLTWTLTPPPTCDIPRALNVNVTSLNTANISWNVPNTGTPVGYQYIITQSDTNPTVDGIYTTATSVNGVTITPNVDSYLHVRTICSTADGNSPWQHVAFFSGYCVPKNTTQTSYYITEISTAGGETNFTKTSTGFSAYTDNTATNSVSTYPGGSFIISAKTPNTTDNFRFSVWVDWNNDFDFVDTGERMVSSGLITTPATIGTLTIPAAAAQGSYRMRIRNTHIGSPVPACGEAAGEAEDYTLVVTAVPSCLPPFNISINPTDAGFANLRWSPPLLGNPPASYEYVLSTSPNIPSGSGTLSPSFFVENVAYDPSVPAYLFVRSNCSGTDHSAWSAPYTLLDINAPELSVNNVIVYKENNSINITSGNALMTGVTIYDIRGSKLYSQGDINNNEVAISGLQIQQQVVIVEVKTVNGIVRKRIVF